MEMGFLQYLGTYDEPNGVSELNAALQNDESYGLPLICDDVTDVTVNCNYCKLLCHKMNRLAKTAKKQDSIHFLLKG